MSARPVSSTSAANAPKVRFAHSRDFDVIRSLLSGADLPLDGLDDACECFVAQVGDRIVGAIALEPYGGNALLRSAVVHPEWRGRGIGGRLTARLIDESRQRGVRALFLLTLDAEPFFDRYGFQTIPRSEVPEMVLESPEFRYACPDTATVMCLRLS
jgi:N-acetylglutamate synthase-like GNAT family acetyltransferase